MSGRETAGWGAFADALNETLSAEVVRMLVDTKVEEGLHHDYKGNWFSGPTPRERHLRAGALLRKIICAFANSDGGVVLIGVHGDESGNPNDHWKIVGIGKDEPGFRQWASQELRSLAPYLFPRPAVGTVKIDDETLVGYVAVWRAPELVRYEEGGRTMMYVRLHDGSYPTARYQYSAITDSLYADLVLRRRQQAHLTLDSPQIRQASGKYSFRVYVTNQSPLMATDVALTLIHPHPEERMVRLPHAVKPRLKVTYERRVVVEPGRLAPAINMGDPGDGVLLPFNDRPLKWGIHVERRDPTSHYIWRGAVLVTSSTSLPTFWQLHAVLRPKEHPQEIDCLNCTRCDDDELAIVEFCTAGEETE